MNKHFEAIVVGAGHAGLEAAFALARKGHSVAFITLSKNRIAEMPCNPSIGGPAKGIITREIDALGGVQGFFADQASLQIKMLNEGKGPAVHALRAQIDKEKYSKIALEAIQAEKLITLIEGVVTNFEFCNGHICGVKLESGASYHAKTFVITTGTYMASEVLRGLERVSSGPDNQRTTSALSSSLRALGVNLQRLKTGTPPRVATDSIDFSKVEREVLPLAKLNFSLRSKDIVAPQVSCYLTYTTPETHRIVLEHLTESTMYSGQVVGVGPRYCPSIEDKIVRFSDKPRHQIFYEPETAKGDVIYVQGFSTSMPIYVQEKLIHSLPGMANARVVKWAYAIEYDALDPSQLTPSLALKTHANLFFAGQINGTSGYEEAAAQGLVAGINAALWLEGKAPLILRRDEAYIGVMIDDLVTKGTQEPYRMLTSRAEYRLLLRNDNADFRLCEIGHTIGLISTEILRAVQNKYAAIAKERERLANIFVSANDPLAKKYDAKTGPSLLQLLMRPDVDYHDISNFEFMPELTINLRLEGYIRKQETEAKKLQRLERLRIPANINYDDVTNLATEARQKLKHIRPETIGQATRISGINPADIQMIMFHMEVRRLKKVEN